MKKILIFILLLAVPCLAADTSQTWIVGYGVGAADTNGGGGLTSLGNTVATYCNANGSALYTAATANYTHGSLTVTKEGAFAVGLDGLMAFVTNGVWGGWVLIDSSTADTIVLAAAPGAADADSTGDVTANVGGSMATLAAAIGNGATSAVSNCSGAATQDNRYVYVGGTQDLSGGKLTVATSGNVAYNNKVIVEGFGSELGDYTERDETVLLSGGGTLVASLMLLDNIDNIQFRQIAFYGTTALTPYNGIDIDNDCVGLLFYQCKIDEVYIGINIVGGISISVIGCDFGSTTPCTNASVIGYGVSSSGLFLSNCHLTSKASYTGAVVLIQASAPAYAGDVVVQNCIFDGDYGRGINYQSGTGVFITNNTFYNFSIHGVFINGSTATAVVLNNIFMGVAAADYAVQMDAAPDGSSILISNNVTWTLAGVDMTMPFEGLAGDAIPALNTLACDPQFVSSSDLRVQNPAVLRGGMKDVLDRPSVIGAIQPELSPNLSRGRARYSGYPFGWRY